MGAETGVDDVLDPILEWFREIEDHVPGIVGRVLRFLVDIPQGSEVGMFNLADAYGNAAAGMAAYLDSISSLNDPIATSWGGDGAVAFQEYWGGYIEQVTNSIASLTEMQAIVQDVGLEIEMAKFMAAMNLYMLADAIFTILSTAAITFGLSTVAAPAAEAACEAGIKSAGRTLLEKILGQKVSGVVADFTKYLGDKALPSLLKDAGSTAAKDVGTTAAKDLGQTMAKDLGEDLGKTAAKDAATDLGADGAGDFAADGAGDAAAQTARTIVADVARSAGGKIVDAGKFVAERLSLRGIAARGVADRTAAAFAKEQLETGLARTLGNVGKKGLTRAFGESLAGKSATAMVREAAYQSALADLREAGLRDVVQMVGKDAMQGALGGARGFVEFQLKTSVGLTALQWAEGHKPHLDIVSLGKEALSSGAIGAFGGPLTTVLGHGIVGSMASMTGGTAAVDGIKTAMGQQVNWAQDMQGSLAFGGTIGAQHGIGEVGGHLIDRAYDRIGGRDAGTRSRDGLTEPNVTEPDITEPVTVMPDITGSDAPVPAVSTPGASGPDASPPHEAAVVDPAVVDPAVADAAAPHTPVPDTPAPDTPAPDTPAPDTPVHDTPAHHAADPVAEVSPGPSGHGPHGVGGTDSGGDSPLPDRRRDPAGQEPVAPPPAGHDPAVDHQTALVDQPVQDQAATGGDHSAAAGIPDAALTGPMAETRHVDAADLNLPGDRLDGVRPDLPEPQPPALTGARDDVPANPVEARQLADHLAHLNQTHADQAQADQTQADQTHPDQTHADQSGPDRRADQPASARATGAPVSSIDFSTEHHLGPSVNFDPARDRYAADLPRDVHRLVERARTRLLDAYPEHAVSERIGALDRIDAAAADLESRAEDARASGDLRDVVAGVRDLSRRVNEYSSAYDLWRDFAHGGRPADPGWRDLDGVDPLNSTEMAYRMVSVDPELHHLDVMDRAIAIAKIGDVLGPEFETHATHVLERAIPRSAESAEYRLGPDVASGLASAINEPMARGMYDARSGVTVVDTMDQGQRRSVSAVAATIVHESMHALQPNLTLLGDHIQDAVRGRPGEDATVTEVRARLMFEREYQAFTVQQHFLRGLSGFRERLDESHNLRIPRTDRYQELAGHSPEAVRDLVVYDYIEGSPQFDYRTGEELLGPELTGPDFLRANPDLAPDQIVARARDALVEAYPEDGPGTPGGLQGPATAQVGHDYHIDLDALRAAQRDLRLADVHNRLPEHSTGPDPEHEAAIGSGGDDRGGQPGAGPGTDSGNDAAAQPQTVIHADAVPGDNFNGLGVVPSGKHHDELMAAVPDAIARAVEGHGDAELTAVGGQTYRIDLPSKGSFTVRVETQWLGVEAAAESHLNHDKEQHVIQLSDQLRTEHVERALAHEIGEIIADRDRYLRGEPGNPSDALRPGELEPDARLSPHDAGRIQELRLLGQKLGDLPSAAERTPEQELAYQRLLRSALALTDHLGLRSGEPGAHARRQLIADQMNEATRAAIDRTLAVGGRTADQMSATEHQTWSEVRDAAVVDQTRTAAWNDGLKPLYDRPVAYDGGKVTSDQARVLAGEALAARTARSAQTLADLRSAAEALPPGEYVHVRLQAGGGASLAGRDPGALLVDERGRWQSDNGTVIAQTADQLRNLNRTGIGDPYQFVRPGERVPLEAVSYWEDSIAAIGPVIDGSATLRLDEHGNLLVDVVPADGSPPLTMAVDGTPMVSTGFPPEAIPGVDREIGGVRGTFSDISEALADLGASGDPAVLAAKAEVDALAWSDPASAAALDRILAAHGLDRSTLPARAVRSIDAIDNWHRLRQSDPERILTGDEANLRRDSSVSVSSWVVAGTGGTAISGIENMLRNSTDSRFTMVGSPPSAALAGNTQWKQVRAEHDLGYDPAAPRASSHQRPDGSWPNPAASGRLTMVFGRTIDGVERVAVGGVTHYSVAGITAEGVVVSLGGRSAVPHALADLVDRAHKSDPNSVSGELLFDSAGQYLGYRITVNGRAIDVTGAASRFYPGHPFFPRQAGRHYDHPATAPYDSRLRSTTDPRYVAVPRVAPPLDSRPPQSAERRDAPPESGNFDGGYVATAIQVSHYVAAMRGAR